MAALSLLSPCAYAFAADGAAAAHEFMLILLLLTLLMPLLLLSDDYFRHDIDDAFFAAFISSLSRHFIDADS